MASTSSKMNPGSRELGLIKLAAETSNPSWLCVDPSGRYLYSINEDQRGSVSAFAVRSGELCIFHPLNPASSEGAGPAHLSVDASGKYVFVANYGGGSIAAPPVLPTGALGASTYVHQDKDSVGPKIATTAPAGSFAFDGHNQPDAHMIQAGPWKPFLGLQMDLGHIGFIFSASIRARANCHHFQVLHLFPCRLGMVFVTSRFIATDAGYTRPRKKRRPWLFFVLIRRRDCFTRSRRFQLYPLGLRDRILPRRFGYRLTGKFLYVANRLKNTVAVFSLNDDGRLTYVLETSTMGDYPRNIAIDPGGDFLYACNHRSDDITSFRVDKKTGLLTFTGQYTSVGSPACITFLA